MFLRLNGSKQAAKDKFISIWFGTGGVTSFSPSTLKDAPGTELEYQDLPSLYVRESYSQICEMLGDFHKG